MILTSQKRFGTVLPVLALLGLGLYFRTLWSEFQFDDYYGIIKNGHLYRVGNLSRIWTASQTRFLTYISFALNYHFSGANPFSYHAVNLLIHIFVSFFVFVWGGLLFQTPALSGRFDKSTARSISFFAAVICLVHPLQTESVAYVSQRATLLAALFYLGALILYHQARTTQKRSFYAWAIVTTWLAMFTKPVTFTLPFSFLLIEAVFWNEEKGNPWQKKIVFLLPFMLSLCVIPALHAWNALINRQDARFLTNNSVFLSRNDYWVTQIHVLRTYVRLFFLPVHQNLDYDYPVFHSLAEPSTAATLFFLISLFGFAIFIRCRHPLIAFGILWFFLTLSVESIMPLNDVIFEHRMYLPLAGLSLGFCCILQQRIKDPRKFAAVCRSLILILAVLTFQRNEIWRSGEALWKDSIRKSPNKPRPYHNLAIYYSSRGDFDQAIIYLQKALQVAPASIQSIYALANFLDERGQPDKAIFLFERILPMRMHDPELLNNLGAAYAKRGEYEKAIEYYQKALQEDPEYAPAHNNLGMAYDRMGQWDRAVKNYQEAIRLDPHFAEAYSNLCIVSGEQGHLDQAVEYCQQAIRIDPHYAQSYNNLAVVLFQKREDQKALNALERAVEIDPDFAQANENLAQYYTKKGNLDAARKYLQKASITNTAS